MCVVCQKKFSKNHVGEAMDTRKVKYQEFTGREGREEKSVCRCSASGAGWKCKGGSMEVRKTPFYEMW
jgi:hypothetical protein